MSAGYYNNQQQQQQQHQGYGSHYYHQDESSEAPQYMHQNYGYNHNQGFVPPYQNHSAALVSEEYLRQPATSPYPTAPMSMPEPAPPLMLMTEPPAAAAAPMQQPRIVIVQRPPPRDEHCCRIICRCIDWLLTRICYLILTLVLIAVFIGLAIWLIHKYRRH